MQCVVVVFKYISNSVYLPGVAVVLQRYGRVAVVIQCYGGVAVWGKAEASSVEGVVVGGECVSGKGVYSS